MAGTGDRLTGRSAHSFLQAASAGTFASNHLQAFGSLWDSNSLLYAQALAIPLAFWFKPFCVCLALFWLTYRASHVLSKPLDELASLLGFDIPLIPSIALAGIKADGAIVHWSLPEKQRAKSTSKYEIHLNGIVVDTASMYEEAVVISGLQPNTFYIVRIALINNLDLSSKSPPLRFRTKPASSNDFFHQLDAHDADLDSASTLLRVHPYRGLKDVSNTAILHSASPVAARDAANSISRKRSNTGWRSLQTPITTDVHANIDQIEADTVDGGEVVVQLTERLDQLRREHDEAERQAREEEEEEHKQREDLVRERDELRAEVAEKEKISRNLKKEVNVMERQNTVAQNERSKHERLLQQKMQERTKFKEDTARWAEEASSFRAHAEQLQQQKLHCLEQIAHEKFLLEKKLSAESAAVKSLDDDIREAAAEIKKIERGLKNSSPSVAETQVSLVEQFQQDAEEDRQHSLRKFELQNQYAAAVQRLEQAKRFYLNNVQYLESLRDRRQREEVTASSGSRDVASPLSLQERLPSRKDSQGSRRNGQAAHESPQMATFVPASQPVFGGAMAASSFSNGSLFNFGNLLTIPSAANGSTNEDDRERLTGGALLSPEAGEKLIPADLFAVDDKNEDVLPLPGLGALPGIVQLPGLGPHSAQDHDPGPASPASVSSRAASTFASPQASQQNLHNHLGSPDGFHETDGRSIRSNRSARAATGVNASSRFSAMFSLRQRPKNSSLDDSAGGAPLGRFNSRSMPRQDQGLIGLGGANRRRNSSLSGNVFGAEDLTNGQSGADTAPAQARKRPFNLNPFSKDKASDGWPSSFSPFGKRPVSPRPTSTHSGELPRPSFDSNRWGVDAWQSGESSSIARASPLSLGGWNVSGNQSRVFGSRHNSRRPSGQHGVSKPPEDILEAEDSDLLDPDSEPQLAPIGTKPSSSEKKAAEQADAKLNPNAKDFKTFLSSMRLRDREKSKSATGGSPGKIATPTAEGGLSAHVEHDSPTHSRASRDARSTTTLESSTESRRPSTELVLSPTYSNSEAAASPHVGSAFARESLMQKISRKSSSSKFSLPTFKRDKPRADREPSTTGSPHVPPAEDDEDALSTSVSSLKETRESSEKGRTAARSWSSVLKLSKKKMGTETPSVSELSMASEATGEEDVEGRLLHHS